MSFTCSQSIASLACALAKAQGEMGPAKKDSENHFFKKKYADLSSVWDACRIPLSKYKLSVMQLPGKDEGGYFVTTVLAHESGEFVTSRLHIAPVKDDPQGLGSAITYARRYGLQAIVGIAPEDDDGEGAMNRQGSKVHVDRDAQRHPPDDAAPAKKEPTDEEKRLGNIAKLQSFIQPSRPKGMTVNMWEQMFCDVAAEAIGHKIEGVGIMLDAFNLEQLRTIYTRKTEFLAKLQQEAAK